LQEGPLRQDRVVYVVDDELVLADTIAEILRHEGFEVRTFYDGADVMAHTPELPPDIVVTDYLMPVVNGLVLAEWLKARFPQCRIIMLSGNMHLMPEHVANVPEKLGLTLIAKPISPLKLVAIVKGEVA
jgi:DNA-binding response OmpR family regulator